MWLIPNHVHQQDRPTMGAAEVEECLVVIEGA